VSQVVLPRPGVAQLPPPRPVQGVAETTIVLVSYVVVPLLFWDASFYFRAKAVMFFGLMLALTAAGVQYCRSNGKLVAARSPLLLLWCGGFNCAAAVAFLAFPPAVDALVADIVADAGMALAAYFAALLPRARRQHSGVRGAIYN